MKTVEEFVAELKEKQESEALGGEISEDELEKVTGGGISWMNTDMKKPDFTFPPEGVWVQLRGSVEGCYYGHVMDFAFYQYGEWWYSVKVKETIYTFPGQFMVSVV